MIYEVTLTHSHVQPPAQPAAQPAAQQGGKKRNKGYRRMSRRSRRSKLRSRRTIRRGGKHCSSISMANLSTRKIVYDNIVRDLARQYGKHPDHDYSEDVKRLQNEHCEPFFNDFEKFITRYEGYNQTGLKSFYDALIRRNLNNT